MDRKSFFGKAFKYAVGSALEVASENRVVSTLEKLAEEPKQAKRAQRPPGAQSKESDFLKMCTGCDQCMIACPVNVIMVSDIQQRDPVIYPDEAPCIQCDGFPCISACPTAALSLTNSLDLRSITPE